MGRPPKNIVEQTQDLTENLDALTVDKISEEAPKTEPEPQEMSLKTRAQMENAVYLEPKRKMKPIGKLPEKLQKEHARDWEYVKGILENIIIQGEPISFWYSKYPGDPDCLWQIPCNTPVYLPRMIAKHLEEGMAYHKFGYIEKPQDSWQEDDFTHNFGVTGTEYRGKFRPVEAFA